MRYFFFILLFFTVFIASATHNRAGEITYKQISQLEYEVTVLTYTFTLTSADRPNLEIRWGDDTKSIINRVEEVYLPNNYKRNKYVARHTYPGAATYVIVVEDPNRNYGVQNIPNSVNVVFSIRTIMQITSDVSSNNTPVLLNPPIDKAAVGKLFIHNPCAWDRDGDSLSYKLTKCTGEGGIEIPGYTFPEASHSFYINELTGDLVWDAPVHAGIYNVAMFIEEWRHNRKIGKIERDMQIEVSDVNNNPPQLTVNDSYCIEADSVLRFTVSATDPENDKLALSATGGPFMVDSSRATFQNGVIGEGQINEIFEWKTICMHVRKQPYSITFKAQDYNQELSLVAQKNVNIYVVAPAPKNVVLLPTNTSITVSWQAEQCSKAIGYKIYRKSGSSGFIPNHCQTGVPASTGYVQIGNLTGINSTTFIDNNNGLGLAQGYNYCYLVVAYFYDGAESYASSEVCSELIRGIPVITNVSVNHTDSLNGSIYLAWAKPTQLDTLPSHPHGPYKYLIYRSNDLWGSETQLIDSLSNLTDTVFIDTLINTNRYPHSYKIELYNDSVGKRFLIGAPSIASSVFLKAYASDNKLQIDFMINVPWQNQIYMVYKKNEITLLFDSLTTVFQASVIDSMLANGKNYFYQIKTIGHYGTAGFVDPIINYSQIICATPIDTTPPCSPELVVNSICDSLQNILSWTNPNLSCANDVTQYNIYYSSTLDGVMSHIATVSPATNTTYIDRPKQTMAGCYFVTAVDSFMNESYSPAKICIDSCVFYNLPNIFTPNNDGQNDLFKPINNHFVEKVDMKIYDRWGILVFQTTDPEIKWDGHYMKNNKLVTSGVYYYVCDVYESRLTGLEHRTLLGFVHVMGNEGVIKK